MTLKTASPPRVAFLIVAMCSIAHATLGGDLDSVQKDRGQMKASLYVHPAPGYTVHEMKTAVGTTLREYLSTSGHVFGMAWEGPFIPDMQQILGDYLEPYSSAAQAERVRHLGRRPLSVQQPRLVTQTSGHMLAFSGRAHDPELPPPGVSADAIQ